MLEASISARAMAASAPSFLDDLNDEQREAVEQINGPVLVLAGAGTGKTRVLTTRIAYVLSSRLARPSEILAVTFTNKASREMKSRIGDLIGSAAEGMPWLGTFHAIGVKILRRHAELVGLKNSFTILDTDDQIRLLKQILSAENIDEKRWPARQFAAIIDGWKNRGLTPDKVPSGEGGVFANGRAIELYGQYQARLKELNAVDFGDLLIECLRLFLENPDVLDSYRLRFKYILVDEYQDTNVAQYLWLRLLAGQNGNVCCVGDDDQSIYGWRGAEVDNILRFEKDFPGAHVVRLESNYRSTEHILAVAAGLIAHNEDRLGKTLRSVSGGGEKVTVRCVWDGEEEARAIGEEIEQLQLKGQNLDEIAILVRASFQMREFEERFVTLGLNYRVIGGPRFYERAEIRDALAYFKVVQSPSNDLAFERIVNTPKRGIGNATIQKVHAHARSIGIPLYEAARELSETEELGAKARRELGNLVASFERWRSSIDTIPHTELAETILDESGYTAMWQNDRSPDAPGRLDNLKELIRSMEAYENLSGFLEHVSLVMETEGTGDTEPRVNIMTLHSAKGLEFDVVFLPGWEEGLLPHQRSLDESGRTGLEEERRLAHVGITRAKKLLKIFFTQNRRIHALWQSAIPSRFLDEMPPEHVEVEESTGAYAGFMGGTYGNSRFDRQENPFLAGEHTTPGWQRAQRKSQQQGFNKQSSPIIEGEILARESSGHSSYNVGERVFHQKFGYGKITSIDGNKLLINFEKAGQKRVLDSFVEVH